LVMYGLAGQRVRDHRVKVDGRARIEGVRKL